jgi:hypothetical protein
MEHIAHCPTIWGYAVLCGATVLSPQVFFADGVRRGAMQLSRGRTRLISRADKRAGAIVTHASGEGGISNDNVGGEQHKERAVMLMEAQRYENRSCTCDNPSKMRLSCQSSGECAHDL